MKHLTSGYDHIQDPNRKIPTKEPVFLLRGQDVLAPEILRQWSHLIKNRYGNFEMAMLVDRHANAMIAWQKKHGASIPDLPKKSAG